MKTIEITLLLILSIEHLNSKENYSTVTDFAKFRG